MFTFKREAKSTKFDERSGEWTERYTRISTALKLFITSSDVQYSANAPNQIVYISWKPLPFALDELSSSVRNSLIWALLAP